MKLRVRDDREVSTAPPQSQLQTGNVKPGYVIAPVIAVAGLTGLIVFLVVRRRKKVKQGWVYKGICLYCNSYTFLFLGLDYRYVSPSL